MNKADDTLAEVLSELDSFFASRQAIAGINEVDLQSASQIFQMNEQTRYQPPAPAAPLAVVAEQAAGRLTQEEKGESV